MTPYKLLGPYSMFLPRIKSFEVDHFISILASKWPTVKLLGHTVSVERLQFFVEKREEMAQFLCLKLASIFKVFQVIYIGPCT